MVVVFVVGVVGNVVVVVVIVVVVGNVFVGVVIAVVLITADPCVILEKNEENVAEVVEYVAKNVVVVVVAFVVA